jgi:valyl-tRNA synthetase
LRAIRDIRMRQNVPLKTRLEFSVRCGEETVALLKPMDECFLSMAGAEATAMGPEVTPPALSATTSLSSTFSYIAKGGIKISGSAEVYVNLAGLIDMEAEVARKKQEIEKLAGFIASKQKKLENKNFVDRAPPEVVQKERDSLDDLQSQYESAKAVVGQLLKSNKTP